jgi:formylglycine-generating enzyme required for sulfatase activity
MTTAASTHERDYVVAVEQDGRRREFAATRLPLTLARDPAADVVLEGVHGGLQIGRLGATFFVQAQRDGRNVRVAGAPLVGTRELRDGDVIAFDRARLECRLRNGALELMLRFVVTEGDTAPPDLDELARDRGAVDEVAIAPISFKPSAPDAFGGPARLPSGRTLGIAAAFAVLAVAGWFAFTAKSVALQIEPVPAVLELPGTFFKVKVGERFLLRSGTHQVAAELPGYYPLDAKIEVGALADQKFELALTKLPGIVTIATTPEVGAEIVLDGMPAGVTPVTGLELPPGAHRVELRAPRYQPDVREIEVQGGGEVETFDVALAPDWAVVSVESDPAGATVLVDGVEAARTPADVEILSGDRELEVRLPGYNAWARVLSVTAGEPQQLPAIKLALADGRIDVASMPSEASVSVNGEFRGRTPVSLRLSPGRSHRLALSKPGYETATRELSVAADSGRRLQIELVPEYGSVEIVTTPADAEIWIDGQRRGATPATLELTAVAHALEIRREGYAVERIDVTPRPGFPQRLERRLTELDFASGGGFANVLRTSLRQELRLLPGGQFTMGSSRREVGRRANEALRPVRLTRAFYLGAREVTNAEFRAFKPSHNSGEFSGRSLNDDDQPVVNVSFADVAQYLNWLSVKDGLQPVYEEQPDGWVAVRPLRNGYRLPTEAEWEWAARFLGQSAGLLYPWGADMPPPDRSGNYADVAAANLLPTTLVTYDDGAAVSAPVGTYPANDYGLYDLGGNVAEWIHDLYTADAIDTTERVDDPLGPESGRLHVVRGASWRSATVTDLRVAARASGYDGRPDIGFRIARNLE